MATKKSSFKEKSLSAFLMFVLGFAGTAVLGAIIFVILITLGVVPQI